MQYFPANFNLLGFSISFAAYKISNSLDYIFLFIAMVIANNLTLHYEKQFKGDSPTIFEPEDLLQKEKE